MLYIFLAGLLWGTIGVFVKSLATLGTSPALTSLMRMSFAFTHSQHDKVASIMKCMCNFCAREA